MLNNDDNYEDFEAMLNDYLPDEEGTNKKVKGIVSQIDRNYIYLDVIGQATAARVRTEELEGYNEGDEVEILLMGETKDGDFLIGSRRKIDMEENWEKLVKAFEGKEIVKAKIAKRVKGGYVVNVLFQQAFLPNSLSEIPMKDGEKFVGNEIEVIVKDVKEDRRGKKILVSRKDIMMKEQEEFFNNLNMGDTMEVEVKNILDFGISVRVGKSNGFIHISELSWGKVDKIADLYKLGDKLQAKIISLDKDKKSLKLSVKQLTQDPWETADEKYPLGTEIDGKVTKLVSFGAFVELEEGIEGLVHLSDFTWNKKKINVSEFVKVGDIVKIKVIEMDKPAKRLKFGIKQLSENPWDTAEAKYGEGSVVKGTVVEIKPFGIFAQLEDGIDAFVHQSDFTWEKSHPKFKIGDEVELKVLSFDASEKKIKGGMKQLIKSPWDTLTENYKVGDIVERKITSITDFGLFIEMEKGVDGMIHASQASKDFVKNLKERFEIDEMVKAEIIEIDSAKKRVKLSIKKAEIANEKNETQELIEKYGTVGE
jgi:ribosomal protein S1